MLKLNTFSITARCNRTGQLGVAVSTAVPGVGMLCPFVQAGVGAVATQSFVNPYLGLWGLEYLASGASAAETLELLKTRDDGLALRQFAVVDRHGGSAAYSGEGCDGWYGHLTGPDYAVAGNMLVGAATLDAMTSSFAARPDDVLVERLLAALQAGQDAGGDKRGRQSAAVKVFSTEAYPLVDLRVDEHHDPVPELRRVYGVAREQLLPLIAMLPTLAHPAGLFDMEASRRSGLLQDQ
ncbi:DUF1028 domain-containing protein [Deinococcus sp.]|uniref:DUF1028 domain-containing protein n=1 Tax=Deinococcus sp. TaxID=47478 RepID=UPI002869C9E3|nr:DUF1028 domain-containing protein [Deinococcus sp.]